MRANRALGTEHFQKATVASDKQMWAYAKNSFQLRDCRFPYVSVIGI